MGPLYGRLTLGPVVYEGFLPKIYWNGIWCYMNVYICAEPGPHVSIMAYGGRLRPGGYDCGYMCGFCPSEGSCNVYDSWGKLIATMEFWEIA